MNVTLEALREVALTRGEYAQIVELLGREPMTVELGMFGAMWSEHCGYKHSRPLLGHSQLRRMCVVQGPGENAGPVDIGDGLAAVFKIESHNHPSAVEPYEGAATGVGGIVRDIFTMGARPIAVLDSLRFGPLDNGRNRYLFTKSSAELAAMATCLGIPNVAARSSSTLPTTAIRWSTRCAWASSSRLALMRARASGVGNFVMIIGAETGRDGLHGATFASVEIPERIPSRGCSGR